MKRVVILAVLLLYTFAASGASVHLHFCEDYLVDFSVLKGDHEGCCCEKKDTCEQESKPGFSKPCCTDHIASVRIQDDQLAKTSSVLSVKSGERSYVYSGVHVNSLESVKSVVPVSHAPPLYPRCEVFLFVRSIRI